MYVPHRTTETWSVSPSVDMPPTVVTIPAAVPRGSDISEGLVNYPVQGFTLHSLAHLHCLLLNCAQQQNLCLSSVVINSYPPFSFIQSQDKADVEEYEVSTFLYVFMTWFLINKTETLRLLYIYICMYNIQVCQTVIMECWA
jgi:hypothetical protein